MSLKIERVVENCGVGEGPHWDEKTQSLYFIDAVKHSIYRYVPSTQEITTANTDARVTIIIPVKGSKDTFLITRENKLQIISWDGQSDIFSVVRTIDIGVEINLNDAKCDPTGRLWIGSVEWISDGPTEEKGSLYTIQNGKCTKVLDKITISNGIAFNTQLKKMYYIDSHKKAVDQFDVDIKNGTIKNHQSIFTLSKHDIPGLPDGMTIDSDGNLWVAIFEGGRVIRINPRIPETLLYTLPLPAKQVTSVAFGGQYLDDLYVTTACIKFGTTQNLTPPEHGATYKVTGLGVRGLPAENFVL